MWLQLVQKAAARVPTRTKRRELITSALASLHNLPVTFRVNFKILVLTDQAESLVLYLNAGPLRSIQGLLVFSGTKLKRKGDSAFSVYS